MLIYRIEHQGTRLGPYHHAGQIKEVVWDGIHSNMTHFPDLDEIPEVARLLRHHPLIKFGFSTYDSCRVSVRDASIMIKHGFVISVYDADPLYRHPQSGQVLFICDTKDTFGNIQSLKPIEEIRIDDIRRRVA